MTSFFRGAPLQTALLCGLFLVPTVTMAGPVADAGYELVRFEPGTYTMGDSELTPKPSEPRRGLLPPAMAAEIRAGVAAELGTSEPSISREAWGGPRDVTLTRPFLIGTTEVTRKLWFSVMDEEKAGIGFKKNEDGTRSMSVSLGGGTSKAKCEEDDCPIVGPDWYDAVRFCNKLSELEGLEPVYTIIEPGSTGPEGSAAAAGLQSLSQGGSSSDAVMAALGATALGGGGGPDPVVSFNPDANGYRLPTEAEWEYAARFGSDTRYAGSDDLWEVAHPENKVIRVAQLKPTSTGLHDMNGNVWEWMWDWHAPLQDQGSTDPLGPTVGQPYPDKTGMPKLMKVTRGGSCTLIPMGKKAKPRRLTVFRRQWEIPYCEHTAYTGLRLVRNAE